MTTATRCIACLPDGDEHLCPTCKFRDDYWGVCPTCGNHDAYIKSAAAL